MDKRIIVKIGDFGLSRYAHHAENWPIFEPPDIRTDVTHGVCTLWYRAPEIILQSKTHDFSLDVWSLGVVVYQLFFKIPPFGMACTESQLLYEIFSR